MQAAATAEVEPGFALGAGVPAGEVRAGGVFGGEDAGLCAAEHPVMAATSALAIAATTVTRGRDRLVTDGCPSLAPPDAHYTIRHHAVVLSDLPWRVPAAAGPRTWRRGHFARVACISPPARALSYRGGYMAAARGFG